MQVADLSQFVSCRRSTTLFLTNVWSRGLQADQVAPCTAIALLFINCLKLFMQYGGQVGAGGRMHEENDGSYIDFRREGMIHVIETSSQKKSSAVTGGCSLGIQQVTMNFIECSGTHSEASD